MKRNFLTVYALALVVHLGVPALALAQSVQGLQARIEAQDIRIRDLEAKLQALLAATQSPQPSSAVSAAQPKTDPVTIKLRGRVQADALILNAGDGATPTGTQIRRFYLGAEGKFGNALRYQAEADFAGNHVSLQDVLMAYQFTSTTELAAGYFKPQITQDDTTSDVQTLFLERSAYAGIFAPGRRVGVGVNYGQSSWGLHAGLFGEKEDVNLDVNRSEAWVASLRAHADVLPGSDIWHVAFATYWSEPSSSDHLVAFSQKPETNRALNSLSTGNFAVDHGVFFGAETGYAHGPFTVQAEGGVLRFDSAANSDPRFWGWSAQASWRLTGEMRPYDVKSGVFGRVMPLHALGAGGWGAVELGVRATHVDLNDGAIVGGKLTTYGAVFNWYPLARVRVGANVIFARTERPNFADTDQTTGTLRAAVDW